jgi:hypothetical protein
MVRKSHCEIPGPTWTCPHCGFVHTVANLMCLDLSRRYSLYLHPAAPIVHGLLLVKVVIVEDVRRATEETIGDSLLADFAVRKRLSTDQRRGMRFSVIATVYDFVNP